MESKFLNLSNKDDFSDNIAQKYEGNEKLVKITSLIKKYNKKIFIELCITRHSAAILFITIFSLVLYSLNMIEVHNKYSIWFILLVLTAVFVVSIILFYFQNRNNIKGFQSIPDKQLYNIRREGISKKIREQNITCGDVIKLEMGEEVPADVKIISCNNLEIKNYTLSDEIITSSFVPFQTNETILKSKNILLQGSKVIKGNVSGIVINSGISTFLNQILHEIVPFFGKNNFSHKYTFTKTFLTSLNAIFVYWIGITIMNMIYLIFSNQPKWQLLYITIGFGASLSSLTTMVILAVSLSISRRHFPNCQVNKSESAVTLGQMNVLFINDFSMFYQNRFIISNLWLDGHPINCKDIVGEMNIRQSYSWTALTRASVLSNHINKCTSNEATSKANLENKENIFSEIDECLLKSFQDCEYIQKWGGSFSNYRENNISLLGPKYDPIINCEISIHQLNDGDPRLLLVVKGSPVDILRCCSTVLICGKEEKVELWNTKILDYYNGLKQSTTYIRAFCDFRLNPENFTKDLKEINIELENFIPRNNLRFIGIISFENTLKPSILTTIDKCNNLGVQLVFTSDTTDIPILSMCKGLNSEKFNLVSASTISSLSKDEFNRILGNKNLIISGANKKLKNKLINFPQVRKNIVGVIESDVQYLPNILAANVGILSQTKCNNLCKQLSDILVMDNNFESLVGSIQESKNVFRILSIVLNVIHYPKISFLFGFLFFTFLGVPLIINLSFVLTFELCFLFPTICLAFEKLENNLNKKSSLMNYGLINQIGCIQLVGAVFSYITIMALHGFRPEQLFMIRVFWYNNNVNDLTDSYGQEWTYRQRMNLNLLASSTVFVTLVILQIVAILATMSRSQSIFTKCTFKYYLIASLSLSVLLAALFIYGGSKLKIVELCPVELLTCLTAVPYVAYIIIFTEIRKYFVRNFNADI